MRFWIKEGDTAPAIEATLTDYAGAAVDLTSATSSKFKLMDKVTGDLVVDAAASPIAPITEGRIRYVWQTGDTAVQGDYAGEFEVMFGSAKQTWPTDGFIEVTIAGDLDSVLTDLATVTALRKMCGEVGETTYTDNELIEAYFAREELEATAHDVWTWKAAEFANLVDVNEGGSDRKLSQLLANAERMAAMWAAKSYVIQAQLQIAAAPVRGTRVKKITRD